MTTVFPQSSDSRKQVICLHGSMSSSRQWDGLVKQLEHSHRVTAVDLHGYGDGPKWGYDTVSLQREAAILDTLPGAQQEPVHLVGHSYGGAVAIKAAQIYGERIRSLTVYEPPVFSTLFTSDMIDPAIVREAGQLIADVHRSHLCGNADRAAQRFIDYWSGCGSWDAIAPQKQQLLAQKIPAVLANFEALLSETDLFTGLAESQIPTLCLAGEESPAVVAAMSQALQHELPHAQTHRFTSMGHLGPVTHTDIVNERIVEFIQCRDSVGTGRGYAQAA